MNITIEELAACKKLLRVDVDAKVVDAAFDSVTRDFQKQAHLAGFRAGKAPRVMVETRYKREIEDEVKRKVISESYRKALEEKKLRVVTQPEIEEIQFGRGQPLQFAATLETVPEFELPEYKGLPVRRTVAFVTDADVERAINVLREQRPLFTPVQRPVQAGDIVIIDYEGKVEGVSMEDLALTASRLAAQKNFWVEIKEGSFIPGFTEPLIGAVAGDSREVAVDFPADFPVRNLGGHKGLFQVKINEVRERSYPPVDDDFARSFEAENLEKLREGVRRDLQNELDLKHGREVRNQLVRGLLDRVHFDLPESILHFETRNAVYDIVRENQQRGVTQEAIEKQKDEIYNFASNSARERLKANFILLRIAEREKIEATNEEIAQRIYQLSAQNNMKPDQLLKQLKEKNALDDVRFEVVAKKVVDFLQLHARIEEVPQAAKA